MKQDFNQIITDQVLTLMQEHGTNWQKPWKASAGMGHMNATTGKAYQGTNIFLTAISAMRNEFSSNEWATFKQWKTKKATVRKGQKGTAIIFFDRFKITDKETQEEKMIPLLKSFTIFNADQVDGYDAKPVKEITPKERDAQADALIAATGAVVKHGGDKAFYVPSEDFIQMPVLEDFTGTKTSTDRQAYYSTYFHELGHWTGHKTRLDRKMIGRFGSNAYAFEELIAELTAVFVTCSLGIDSEPRADHAKYLNNWIEVIKSDNKAMIKAFAQAQKASNFIQECGSVKEKESA